MKRARKGCQATRCL